MATQQELDDLDDLDDILDDFDSSTAPPSSTASDLPQPSKNTSTHGPPKPPPPSTSSATLDPPSFTEEDFAKQLQQGMEQLMRDMESPSTRNEFESLVKSMSDATAAPKPSGTATTSFSETISRTMERMQESETAADQASTETPNETDAFLAEMLRQLDSAGGGDGVGGEEGMAKLLEGMMEQLMSKEILYEPMKDLQEKYPDWLKSNKEKLSAKDYENYSKQAEMVEKVMTRFNDPTYDDEDKKTKAELVDLMGKMQELGAPPKEIMSELAPGMELDADGLPGAPAGDQCCVM